MPFFFQTSNASVPYRAGGHEFTFEPIEVIAGSWRGVLEVATEAEAEALRTIKGPVSEVTAEEYAAQKKKWFPNSRRLTPSVEQSPQTLHEVAASVALNPEAESSTDTEAGVPALAAVGDAPVNFKLGTAEPPNDLAEEAPAKKSRKK